jgi:O-methyltransferase
MNFHYWLRSLLPRELNIPQDLLKQILAKLGYFRLRTRIAAEGAHVPDIDLYRPLFSPWEGVADFRRLYKAVRPHSLVSADRCWILAALMRHAQNLEGDFAELGVYRGGTALLAAMLLSESKDARPLHLFDSFAGMPPTSEGEPYKAGDFNQTSEESVGALVRAVKPDTKLHVGFIPDTFVGLEVSKLAFAHIDVDLYQSVIDSVAWVYPRLVPGGILVFDDYGNPSCVRAREATEKAFSTLREKPIYLPTGQALIIKLGL